MASILKSRNWIPDSRRVEIGIWRLEVSKTPKLQTPTSKFHNLEKNSTFWNEFLSVVLV